MILEQKIQAEGVENFNLDADALSVMAVEYARLRGEEISEDDVEAKKKAVEELESMFLNTTGHSLKGLNVEQALDNLNSISNKEAKHQLRAALESKDTKGATAAFEAGLLENREGMEEVFHEITGRDMSNYLSAEDALHELQAALDKDAERKLKEARKEI